MWETGAVSTEYLETLYKDIPVDLAIYAKENDLLKEDRLKLTERPVKQAKLKSFRISPRYKYGFKVPKNFKHTEKLDKKNCNSKWMDSNKLEHKQLEEYDVFIDKGKFAGCRIPGGFRFDQSSYHI